jgi:hypothetical protein
MINVIRSWSCFINTKSLSQSRSLTQNVFFSVDAKPAVDDYKKLYHKHYTLTIRLEGKKEEKNWISLKEHQLNMRWIKKCKQKKKKDSSEKAISRANICLLLGKMKSSPRRLSRWSIKVTRENILPSNLRL